MKRRRPQSTLPLLLALVACGRGDGTTDAGSIVLDDGAVVPPGQFSDPLEHLQRLPGPTFVEIAEVRTTDDGRTFFCSGVQGLNIVDTSDPNSMSTRHQLSADLGSGVYPRCQHLAVDGDRLYLTNRGDQIQPMPFVASYDLSGSQPRELGSYTAPGRTFEGIAAGADRVFVAQHADGIGVLRAVGDNLTLEGEISGLENAWSIAVGNGLLYVADGIGGLAIVEAFVGGRVLGRVALEGSAQHVEYDAARTTAWVSAGSGGLYAVDVSDQATPTVVGRYNSPGTALQVALDGDYAYLADWNDVRVFDISDRTAPRLVATERIEVSSAFPRVLGISGRDGVVFAGEWTGLHSFRLHPDRTAPDLWLAQREADLGPVPSGSARARAIILENQGNEPLGIWRAAVTGDGEFSVNLEQVIVPAGTPQVLEVTFRPTNDGERRATLELSSDDPDEPTRTVGLSANTGGLGVGDDAPPVTWQLLDGGTTSLAEHAGKVVVLSYFATF